MKINKNFMLKNIAGQDIVVPLGEAAARFNGMISLNETGAFLWKCLGKDASEEDLVSALTAEYEIDIDTAKADVSAFVEKMKAAGIVE